MSDLVEDEIGKRRSATRVAAPDGRRFLRWRRRSTGRWRRPGIGATQRGRQTRRRGGGRSRAADNGAARRRPASGRPPTPPEDGALPIMYEPIRRPSGAATSVPPTTSPAPSRTRRGATRSLRTEFMPPGARPSQLASYARCAPRSTAGSYNPGFSCHGSSARCRPPHRAAATGGDGLAAPRRDSAARGTCRPPAASSGERDGGVVRQGSRCADLR